MFITLTNLTIAQTCSFVPAALPSCTSLTFRTTLWSAMHPVFCPHCCVPLTHKDYKRIIFSQSIYFQMCVLSSPLLTYLFPTATSHISCASHNQSWTVVPILGHISYLCYLSCSLSDIRPLVSLTNVSSCLKRCNIEDLFCFQSVEICRGISLSMSRNRKACLDHMFSVAYGTVFAKSTKAADSDTGGTDVKRSFGKIALVS